MRKGAGRYNVHSLGVFVLRSAMTHCALVVQLAQAWQMGTPSGTVRPPKDRHVSQQRIDGRFMACGPLLQGKPQCRTPLGVRHPEGWDTTQR